MLKIINALPKPREVFGFSLRDSKAHVIYTCTMDYYDRATATRSASRMLRTVDGTSAVVSCNGITIDTLTNEHVKDHAAVYAKRTAASKRRHADKRPKLAKRQPLQDNAQ